MQIEGLFVLQNSHFKILDGIFNETDSYEKREFARPNFTLSVHSNKNPVESLKILAE